MQEMIKILNNLNSVLIVLIIMSILLFIITFRNTIITISLEEKLNKLEAEVNNKK